MSTSELVVVIAYYLLLIASGTCAGVYLLFGFEHYSWCSVITLGFALLLFATIFRKSYLLSHAIE